MERRYSISMKEMKRYYLIEQAIKGKMHLTQAARIMGISYRQALRLKKRVIAEGMEGIISKHRTPHNKIPEEIRNRVVDLYTDKYGLRLNILHFKEKLEEKEGIKLSYETIRQILIKNKIHKTKHHKHEHRNRRARMPAVGIMLQMDSSESRWIPDVKEEWWLISVVEDATSEIVYAKFAKGDTTYANMAVIKEVIKRKGLFMSLYVDKASHFTTTRHGGLWNDVKDEHKDTNIEKALKELGITLIPANSPQAKGRIERSFRTMQDRLVNEMWLEGIDNYNDANKYLEEKFFNYYNSRFAVEPMDKESRYMKVSKKTDLDIIFTKRLIRSVRKDNTISVHKEIIQLPEVVY